jgi:ABC-2 type transport system permease protein
MLFITSLRKELMELFRTGRAFIILAVVLTFGLTSPMVAKYTPEILSLIPETEILTDLIPEPTLLDAVNQFMKNTYQFGLILAILVTMGSVVREKDTGTASMVLVKPLPRATFIISKFTALAMIFLGCILLSSLGAYYYSVLLFIAPDLGPWLWMTLILWLLILVYVAITLAFSTLFRSQAVAAGLAFGLMLLFSLMSSFPGLARYTPGYLLTWAGHQFTNNPIVGWTSLIISLAIVVTSLLIACISIRYQEF